MNCRMFCGRLCLVALAMLSLGSGAIAGTKEDDAIEYRQHLMKSLNAQAAAIGQIVSTAISDENAVQHLEVLALTASAAKRSFEKKVPGGEAKPEVWAKWDEFAKRMDLFAAKTANAAKLAKEEGAESGITAAMDALDCKGCHKIYRAEKKKK